MIAGEFAVIIALWFVALQIWDLPTLLGSLRTAGGVARLLCGIAVALLAMTLLALALPWAVRESYSGLAIVTFLTALAVELIVGEDVRRALLRKR